MCIYFLFILFSLKTNQKKNTPRYPEHIWEEHKKVKKKCHGWTYIIKNSHGYFSVCTQNHFKYDAEGWVTYYDEGQLTATCEPFNPNFYTAAHPFLPLPSIIEVSEIKNPSNKIILKVNDRGPLVRNDSVILDVTILAAKKLNFVREGRLRVRVRLLEKATKLLKEHGGPIDWKGGVPFEIAFNDYLDQCF